MELPPECTDAETLQAKKAPTKASLSRPLELSHFSLHTPRQSAAPSPREGSDGGMSTAIPDGAEHEQEAALNYEWHFEILNHLPRDTAMALMDHLKSLDYERQKAQRYARELNQSNKELHRRLQQKKDGTRSSKRGILSLVIVTMVCLVLSIGAASLMDVRKPLLSSIDTLRGLLADEATQTTSSIEAMPTTCLEGQSTLSDATSTGAKSPEEEKPKESVTKEVDPKIQQLQTENIQMRVQLERLWIMIEEAEKKGEDQVCWKL